MIVEFLLNGIKDMSKLYTKNMVEDSFGGGEKIPQYDYVGQNYLKQVINEIVSKLPDIQEHSYEHSFERFANEVFVIITSEKMYEMIFTIDTYNYEKARMKVNIRVEKREEVEQQVNIERYMFQDGTEYDMFLEQLKIELKNILLRDWLSCSWIMDQQSEQICSFLYPYIFRGENNIRAFANKVLSHKFGQDWLKQTGLEKYYSSHKTLSADFKRSVPCFANIDDVFISMTIETMMEVIQKARIYEDIIELTDEDYKKIHQRVAENGAKSVLELLRKKRKVKVDFWKDVFEQYLVSQDDTQTEITNFIKNRNHIAHNKLMNWSAYQKMLQNFIALENIISKANAAFESSVPSEELYMTWDAEEDAQRMEEMEAEWERNYARIRIEEETGVSIRHDEDIYDMFCEKLDELYTEFDDEYYFNPCFSVSQQYGLDMEYAEQTLFSVQSNADTTSTIEVSVIFSIDGEMDGDSSVTLICRKKNDLNNKLFSATLRYHNGAGYEDRYEGVMVLESESEYDESELKEFTTKLRKYIKTELNSLIAKKERLEFEAQRSGGEAPVADFSCIECGEYGISIMDEFYSIGYCCYCGTENEVTSCEICETIYGDGGGEQGICNSCREKM